MSKEDFWTSTPRKLILLLDQHLKYEQLTHGIEPDTKVNDNQAFNDLMKL